MTYVGLKAQLDTFTPHASIRVISGGKCGITAGTLPPCDLEWGHDGDMHCNAGDGFYARDFEDEHHRRQRSRARRKCKITIMTNSHAR